MAGRGAAGVLGCDCVAGDAAIKQILGWRPSSALGLLLEDTATGIWQLLGPVRSAL